MTSSKISKRIINMLVTYLKMHQGGLHVNKTGMVLRAGNRLSMGTGNARIYF